MLKVFIEYIGAFLIAAVISILLVSEVFAVPEVRQSSMEYTLHEGERVLLNKIGIKFGEVHKGDIIVFIENPHSGLYGTAIGTTIYDITSIFKVNEPTKRLVKRVIGIPGDKVVIRDGKVFVNGEEETGSYLHSETYPVNGQEWTVGEGQLFVLGDNREVSRDSREFGLIDSKSVEGTVVFRFWPMNKFGQLK